MDYLRKEQIVKGCCRNATAFLKQRKEKRKMMQERRIEKRRFGISGSLLKMIALVSMTIDHIGAVIIQRFMVTPGFESDFWESLYWPFRNVGRMAFPIFCFLLVEGFQHTRNRNKYFFRMLVFALISEIPFNLAIQGELFVSQYQNVFWELALGILLMMVMEKIDSRKVNTIFKISLTILVVIIGALVAETLHFDYGEHGIISIALLYYFRQYRGVQILVGSLSFLWYWKALFGFLPIALYNGKRGGRIKYAFYIFYPSHLLILYLVAKVAGCIY